jgi:lysophospholipase L1-like esterase
VLPRQASFRPKVEALNAQILHLASERALPFIDLYPSFVSPEGGIRKELTYDDLHLSGAGYHKWQELIQPHVRA